MDGLPDRVASRGASTEDLITCCFWSIRYNDQVRWLTLEIFAKTTFTLKYIQDCYKSLCAAQWLEQTIISMLPAVIKERKGNTLLKQYKIQFEE